MNSSIKIDISETAEGFAAYESTVDLNFSVTKSFKIQQFTDPFIELVKIKKSEEKRIRYANRMWGHKANHVYNIRKLCFDLLEPIERLLRHKIEIVCGITNPEVTKLIGLSEYSQMKYGKAVIFKVNFKNNFDTFLRIIMSDLKFSELIYFSATDVLYIGLPTEVIKDVVKVK